MVDKQDILKQEYVAYFADVPVQRYAAMYIGRDEDTVIRWRKEDPVFAEAIQRAKAVWIRKKLIATKAEFALERLEKSVFSEKVMTEPESAYDTFIQQNTIDPNDPIAKQFVEDSLALVMAQTARIPTAGTHR